MAWGTARAKRTKCICFDGHEREDVKEPRQRHVEEWERLESMFTKWTEVGELSPFARRPEKIHFHHPRRFLYLPK
ncbi:hypothetical protein K470DRAFT_261128 [Piedraia hortae CBS 480.64]|uniref:Uncharacterized protein n=1 Tax=Piedraia hortae CBS 480.64 TaxID=1314780 RepID=A0A6A7BRG9_9PEZI|nr:hypothetical protein K470DRAFT_261128 [Piedraia hortae CBS 480.64]